MAGQSTAPQFSDLPRLQRNAVRMVARDAWLRCDGHANRAILTTYPMIRRHVGKQYLPIGEALAATLIRYWQANNVPEPESIGVPGEPGWESSE